MLYQNVYIIKVIIYIKYDQTNNKQDLMEYLGNIPDQYMATVQLICVIACFTAF